MKNLYIKVVTKIVQSLINKDEKILILRNACWSDDIYYYALLKELYFLC